MSKELNYSLKVRLAAERRDGEPLYNGSLDHATTLAESMFAFANDHINILTGELNARVYGGTTLLDNARALLSKPGCVVRVLIEDEARVEPHDHPFIKEFWGRSDVKYKVLPEGLASLVPYHFIEMDGDSYRYEQDKSRPEAVAAFGDAAGAKRLSGIFEKLWNASADPSWSSSPVASHVN